MVLGKQIVGDGMVSAGSQQGQATGLSEYGNKPLVSIKQELS
jgi:hypothetical protein